MCDQQKKYFSLTELFEGWKHPELALKEKEDKINVLYAILPDIFNEDLVPEQYHMELQDIQNIISGEDTYISKLFNGNYRNNSKQDIARNRLSNVNFLKTLKKHMSMPGSTIVYKDEKMNQISTTPLNDMFRHIQRYMEYSSAIMKNSVEVLQKFQEQYKKVYEKTFMDALDMLVKENTKESLSYAMLLLFLIAIFQTRMSDLEFLYSDKYIERALTGNMEEKSEPVRQKIERKGIRPLTDAKYMDEYYVYFFKSTYEEFYSNAKLKMELLPGEKEAKATLSYDYEISPPGEEKQKLHKIYTGTPFLSDGDSMVHAVLSGEDGRVMILCFPYKHFATYKMFFRIGSVQCLCDDELMLRKIILSAKEFSEKDLENGEGMLRLTDHTIRIREGKMKDFLKKYQSEKWMPQFEEKLLPHFQHRKQVCYFGSEDGILFEHKEDFAREELIEIIEKLYSFSEAPKRIDCRIPSKLYRIIE